MNIDIKETEDMHVTVRCLGCGQWNEWEACLSFVINKTGKCRHFCCIACINKYYNTEQSK